MDDIEKELELDLENMNIDNVDTSVSDVHHRVFLNSSYKYIQCSLDLMREPRPHFRISTQVYSLGFMTLSSISVCTF